MPDLLEIIKELEQSREKLSRLQDGIVPRYDGSIKYDGSTTYSPMKKEGLEPIIEKLNTVIHDLKNSVVRDIE